jgi:hypothetical protein
MSVAEMQAVEGGGIAFALILLGATMLIFLVAY